MAEIFVTARCDADAPFHAVGAGLGGASAGFSISLYHQSTALLLLEQFIVFLLPETR